MGKVRLIEICLRETYNRVRIGKYFSDNFQILNGLNKEMLYHYCFLILI
jgi:hypothetical protein